MIVKAETVVAWHRKGFRFSGRGKSGAASQVGPACRKRFEI
jgi:hypothetical protein